MKLSRFIPAGTALGIALLVAAGIQNVWPQAARQEPRHNVILFVADGLRAVSVTPDSAPNLAHLSKTGVEFGNSHSLYPTVTTANASAIATGHYLGDTGDFGNTLYFGFPIWAHDGAPTASLENDSVLGELDQHFGGNYLNEESLLATARKSGFATAVIGKAGPSLIQDVAMKRDGSETIIMDDSFGRDGGLSVAPDIISALRSNHLATLTPETTRPDIEQEYFLATATAKVVMPRLAASGKPFLIVFWSRDPDYSQHNEKESFGQPEPGINSPTGRAGIRNADSTLALLFSAVHTLGIEDKTDIFVTADHGFATVAKDSKTSSALRPPTPGAPPELPQGFLAMDLAGGLGHKPLFDPDGALRAIDYAKSGTLSGGDGLIGADPTDPEVVVAANGGSDLIYLPRPNSQILAADVVRVLLGEDYVSGIFVDDRLGAIPGTLPMSRINLVGAALTPRPAIVVGFRSWSTPSCDNPLLCTVAISDGSFPPGQGNHGGFSRAETFNFMAAIGPDFKTGFTDDAPVSNADIAPTLARIMGISLPARGKLTGRVIGESLKGGESVRHESQTIISQIAPNGLATILNFQTVGANVYFDAAGIAGRTIGLVVPPGK